MLNPKDLMIGNWFEWDDEAAMGSGYGQIKCGADMDEYPDQKNPIVITKEMLPRFGFREGSSGDNWIHQEDECFELDYGLSNENAFSLAWDGAYVDIEISSVHDLQNKFRHFTNKELPVQF